VSSDSCHKQHTAAVWFLVALLISSVGCNRKSGVTKGEQDNFSFYEPNKYPADDNHSKEGFETPIAVGSEVDVAVSWTTIVDDMTVACLLNSGETEDPEILEVLSLGLAEGPNTMVRLKALKEGSTRLHISASCSPAGSPNKVTDSIVLTVVEPTHATITISEQPTLLVPQSKGFSLRPGASINYQAIVYKDDQRLIGFNLLQWAYDESLLSTNPPEEGTTRWEYLSRAQ